MVKYFIEFQGKEKKIIGILLVLLIIAIISIIWLNQLPEINNKYQMYNCGNQYSYCWKLSDINQDGLQTRCYYNYFDKRRYFKCSTTWTNLMKRRSET